MIVNDHAKQRFTLRANATISPAEGVLEMWISGREATPDDMRIFRVRPRRGDTFRVGKCQSLYCMLIERRGVIVSIIELK